MADNRPWWKLWYSALSDEKLEDLDLETWARWVRLNAWINHHGEKGSVTVSAPGRAFCSMLRVPCFGDAQSIVTCLPGLTVQRDGETPVTLTIKVNKWHKYQVDSSAERMRRLRAIRDDKSTVTNMRKSGERVRKCDAVEERRGEEKRGEEKEQIPYAAPSAPHGVKKDRSSNGADPNIKILLDFYHDTYLAVHKMKPVISGGKDGAICRKLLAGRTLDEARWIVEEHLKHPPDLYERKNLYGLNHVLAAANTILARRDESP